MHTHRLTLRVPLEKQDELVADLWERGTLGVHLRPEDGEELLDAYFESRPAVGDAWRRLGAELLRAEVVEERDWLALYRAGSRPFEVGPFRLDPREPEDAGSEGAGEVSSERPHLLRIPARNAFGTGSHESTRLILEALAELPVDGAAVLDVGTGSGILAYAARRLGAARVAGCDVELASVVAARANGTLNRLSAGLFAGSVAAVGGRFDIVLVNIQPQRWLDHAALVAGVLAEDGDLLVSGLLREQRPDVLEPLAAVGLAPVDQRACGEWSALRLRHGGCAGDGRRADRGGTAA